MVDTRGPTEAEVYIWKTDYTREKWIATKEQLRANQDRKCAVKSMIEELTEVIYEEATPFSDKMSSHIAMAIVMGGTMCLCQELNNWTRKHSSILW